MSAEDVTGGHFGFLNTREHLGFPPDWDDDRQGRLWQYNLHYFDWLWLLDFDAAQRVVSDWIFRYESTGGRVGWEPYPVSVRLMNWCGFFFGRARSEALKHPDFCDLLWRSLYQQCQWLIRHDERHLLNNHYLENGAALAFAGSCFNGSAAQAWLEKGLGILADQLGSQILPDGTHFELSPMYHCRILYVLRLLAETDAAAIVALVGEPVQRMSRALAKLCHPDGRIALLKDSALDVYHAPAGQGVNEPDESGCFALPNAGYYGWRGDDGTYLIADYGPIGPDHNPGHGHAGMLSFELSLKGHRVITDSGVHDYDASPTRQYCRSTAAHNTVEIAGQDQCEMWGAFRVARRGYPRDVRWQSCADGFLLSAWHDGYERLPGRPIHRRRIEWNRTGDLLIQDIIRSKRAVDCSSRLHLHPDCQVVSQSPCLAEISFPAGIFRIEANAPIQIGKTSYFERFYETCSRSCLCQADTGNSLEFHWRITLLDTAQERCGS